MQPLTAIELCAGAGGQAFGLEEAGFEHVALVEIDKHACNTLRLNRPEWNVIESDINHFDGTPYKGVDLLAAGLPCPPFSVAGKQLGTTDDRNLFPAALRLIKTIHPKAVMIENVRGLLDAVFEDYRVYIQNALAKMGYKTDWHLLNASDFGVPQLRPRVIFIAIRKDIPSSFLWPEPLKQKPPTVGKILYPLMKANGWIGAKEWRDKANDIAPTLVGGSKKHGGPDLGPTRAKSAWANFGIDGIGIANEAPLPDFTGMPRLTIRMVARIQGFPDKWQFSGGKTASYRQIGNAFPPPVACAVGKQLYKCLNSAQSEKIG